MTQKRAWPAATTVLAQAASSGKAKNRYIDILIPRYESMIMLTLSLNTIKNVKSTRKVQ